MNYARVFQKIFAKNYFTRSVRKNNSNFSCKYGKLYLPLLAETITTKAMTHEQLKFYFQSFDFETFMDWYNNNMIDPYGDYREQTIQYNREDAHNTIKGLYTLETLWHIMEDDRTMIREDDKYIMVTNGDDPYIVTFSTMEDFFKHVDFEGLASYIDTYPDTLKELQHKF